MKYRAEKFLSRRIMANVEDSKCYACHAIHGKPTPGPPEVWYERDKHWLCLKCHLAERKFSMFKGKGAVRDIVQKCSRCERDCPESIPRWFCYGCSQFLCELCEQETKGEEVCVSDLLCKMYNCYKLT